MKNYIKKRLQYKAYRSKLGLTFNNFYKLSNYSRKNYIEGNTELFGNQIIFSNPFWFLHSLEEIFVEEVYRFKASSESHLIVDCGANIGLSVIYLKKLFPNSKILALEPDKKIFEQLSYNVKSFGYSDSTEVIQAAAWINNENLNFISEGSVGGRISEQSADNNNITSVKALRLKSIIEDKGKIFFLKIDIEGAEYDVLKDIKDSLSNVENLFVEFHAKDNEENKLDEILHWIRSAGFKYYIKEAWNNMSYPFTKEINNKHGFQTQLNISCYRND